MTGPTSWHSWQESAEGDEVCAECGVVVSPDALHAFTLACPSPECEAGLNPDHGCVMATAPARENTKSHVSCVYCGRPGGRGQSPPDDEDDEDWFDDEEAADAAADAYARSH